MLKPFTRWHYLSVWPVAALAIWMLFVPGLVSPSVFAWLNGAVLFMLVFTMLLWNSSRQKTRKHLPRQAKRKRLQRKPREHMRSLWQPARAIARRRRTGRMR